MEVVLVVEFALEREFAAEGFFVFARAPDGECGFAVEPATEVEFADVDLDLLDSDIVDQAQGRLVVRSDLMDGGEGRGEVPQRDLETFARFREDAIVGENRADAAECFAEREEFLLELDARDAAGRGGTDIDPSGGFEIRMPVFKSQLRDAVRPAVLVVRAEAQDEMVFVEVEVGCVEEQDLADMADEGIVVFADLHIELLRGFFDDLPKIHEGLRRLKMLRLQDDFVFAVLDAIARSVLDFVLGHGGNDNTNAAARAP